METKQERTVFEYIVATHLLKFQPYQPGAQTTTPSSSPLRPMPF